MFFVLNVFVIGFKFVAIHAKKCLTLASNEASMRTLALGGFSLEQVFCVNLINFKEICDAYN